MCAILKKTDKAEVHMDKNFTERIYNISQAATKKGAVIKLMPSGNLIIAQVAYKNNTAVLNGSAPFVESMIKAFSNSVASEETEAVNKKAEEVDPQPDNVISMTDIYKMRNQASASKLL
jgi:hypothetical protein